LDTEAAIHDPLRPAIAGDSSREVDADVLERQPKHVRRDLRHDGVATRANMEVAHATSAWPLALSAMRTVIGICNASHTPVAMPQPTRIAFVPAERRGALAVAFTQRLAAERQIVVLIALE